jgi:hypothetical protein
LFQRISAIEAPRNAGGGNLPSIYTAIQEQLGLKLESIRAPVEFVVVDHIKYPELTAQWSLFRGSAPRTRRSLCVEHR